MEVSNLRLDFLWLFAAASIGLAWMGFCRMMIAATPPGGSGEFKGMAHLGWRLGIFLMIGMIPLASLIGLVLGLAQPIVRERTGELLSWAAR